MIKTFMPAQVPLIRGNAFPTTGIIAGPTRGIHCFASKDDEFVGGGGGAPTASSTVPSGPTSIVARPSDSAVTTPVVNAEVEISESAIINLLRTAASDSTAISTIIGFGAPAALSLIKALGDENEDIRKYAAEALGKIGDARAVLPLIKALGDKAKAVRVNAVMALVEIGEAAVLPLIEALHDEHEYVRANAAKVLGTIGDTRAATPLITTLSDVYKDVRRLAAWALGMVGGVHAALPLIKALGDEYNMVRVNATEALGTIGDARAINPLITAMGDKDEHVRGNAVVALGTIGEPAVPPLIKTLHDKNEVIAQYAAWALGRIGEPAVLPLIKTFHDKNEVIAQHAAWTLGCIGEPAVLPLITALRDENENVRRLAAEALCKIDDERAKAAFQQFEAQRKKTEAQRKLRVAREERANEMARAIVKGLTRLLGSPTTQVSTYGDYRSATVGKSLATPLVLRYELGLCSDLVGFDDGDTPEEAQARLRALNFLVHCEVAHALQRMNGIPRPAIAHYPGFDSDDAAREANETMLDKLAFDMASKIYVHGDGDSLFDQETRTVIAVKAYLALGTRIYRDQEHDKKLTDAVFARMIAVSVELAKNEAVSAGTKRELKNLADTFSNALHARRNDPDKKTIGKLLRTYAMIFRKTNLAP